MTFRSLNYVALLGLAACGGGGSSGPLAPNPTPTTTPTPAPVALTISVVANDGARSFSPNPSMVRAGERVAFRNDHNAPHHVQGDGGSIDTLGIAPGAIGRTFSLAAPGSYAYHCVEHTSMVGTLVVTP